MALDKFCRTHTNRAPTGRCKGCIKPMCDECTVNYPNGKFCGAPCRDNFMQFKARGPVEKKKTSIVEVLRNIAIPVVVILGLSYYLASSHQVPWAVWLMQKIGAM